MDELREKVMKGLKCCSNRSTCDELCPYWFIMNDPDMGIDECTSLLASDVLELLKAQEPVQPFRTGGYHPDWCCGNCKSPGLNRQMKFCPACGKAVKWDA